MHQCGKALRIAGWTFFFFYVSSVLMACSVPVFRYALERWPPDNYEVIVFHRGPLCSGNQGVVDYLKNSALKYNLLVKTVDLAVKSEQSMRELWKAQSAQSLPWMVLRYPGIWEKEENVWSGRLSMSAAGELFDSSLRREIGRRILGGESSVWLLLESGDKKKDNVAAHLLQRALNKIQEDLKLPESTTVVDPYFGPELRISFSMLRLSRTDPAERIFVDMLLGIEPSLKAYSDEPIAFAFFGRGRALFGFVGEDINEENIEEGCGFLVGWCSCLVKAGNPGVDLLMPVNWDSLITGEMAVDEEIPPLRGLSEFAEAQKSDEDTSALAKGQRSDTGIPITAGKGVSVKDPLATGKKFPSADISKLAEAGKLDNEEGTIETTAAGKTGALTRNILIILGTGIGVAVFATLKLKKG